MGSCLSVCCELEAMHVRSHASVGYRVGKGRKDQVGSLSGHAAYPHKKSSSWLPLLCDQSMHVMHQ